MKEDDDFGKMLEEVNDGTEILEERLEVGRTKKVFVG
jgi:hypothetical protein